MVASDGWEWDEWGEEGGEGGKEGGDYKMQEMAPGLMHNSFLFTVMGSSFKDSFLRRRRGLDLQQDRDGEAEPEDESR